MDSVSRGQEFHAATIWPSVRNVAVIPDFFLQNALQVEEINEKSLCTSRVDIPCRWSVSQDPHE